MGIFSKERTEKDVLNRIKWDESLDATDFDIGYLDNNEIVTVHYTDVEIVGDFLEVNDTLIPMHRIRKILQNGNVVWAKRRV